MEMLVTFAKQSCWLLMVFINNNEQTKCKLLANTMFCNSIQPLTYWLSIPIHLYKQQYGGGGGCYIDRHGGLHCITYCEHLSTNHMSTLASSSLLLTLEKLTYLLVTTNTSCILETMEMMWVNNCHKSDQINNWHDQWQWWMIPHCQL
jgi:hypothetical protein